MKSIKVLVKNIDSFFNQNIFKLTLLMMLLKGITFNAKQQLITRINTEFLLIN